MEEQSQSLYRLALTYFIIINPIGNLPAIIALIKDFDFQQQKRIMLRESFFTLIVALVFQFVGEYFLGLLHIEQPALSLCGGTLLFFCALSMIFPQKTTEGVARITQEPFIVPIATPLLAGPGTLTFIMVTAAREPVVMKVTSAIVLAGLGVMAVLMSGPYLQRLLGKRGLIVLEQIMGMLLLLMAVGMFMQGLEVFVHCVQQPLTF